MNLEKYPVQDESREEWAGEGKKKGKYTGTGEDRKDCLASSKKTKKKGRKGVK